MADKLDGEIRTIASQAISDGVFSGLVIASRIGDQKRKWWFGHTTFERSMPVEPWTLFDTASVTKLPVTFAILRLIDRGELSLDTPITDFLDFKDESVRKITVRDLLIYNVYFDISKSLRDYETWMGAGKNGKEWLEDFLATAKASHGKPNDPQYTNFPSLLLGLIIEKIVRKRLSPALREIVFEPLSMHGALFLPAQKLSENDVEKYIAKTEEGIPIGTPHDPLARLFGNTIIGDSGMFATADDILRIGEVLATGTTGYGKRYLSSSLHQEMLKRHNCFRDSYGYGLGVSKFAPLYIPEFPLFCREAGLMTGTTGTMVVGSPETDENQKMTIAILANAKETKIRIKGMRPIYGIRRDIVKAHLDSINIMKGGSKQ